MATARRPASALRHGLARTVALAAGRASRLAGRGSGATITGRVLLLFSPGSLARLALGRRVVLVSGTNGKTTTAAMISRCWASDGPIAINGDGANLASGAASALLRSAARHVVLEVDELALPYILSQVRAEAVVLLNLSRDQLDRAGEVGMTVRRWAEALQLAGASRVIGNADDPLVVEAVHRSGRPVTWVSVGLIWEADAALCSRCGQPIVFGRAGWSCTRCSWQRPQVVAALDGPTLLRRSEPPLTLEPPVPGATYLSNAAMAVVTAEHLGVRAAAAATAVREMRPVAGRYQRVRFAGRDVQLLLMKNPAGGKASLRFLDDPAAEVIMAINARAADGRDTSWLWDIPCEGLAGRRVVVTGDRAADVSLWLTYVGVAHEVSASVSEAVIGGRGPCYVMANYTAFTEARAVLEGAA